MSSRDTFRILVTILAVGALIVWTGCGDPDVGSESSTVGGSCSQHSDCDDFCLTDWPGGMCTVLCDDDNDCPLGTACIQEEHGVCLLECREDRDCPGGYECDDEDRRGHSGKRDVCVED